jgi:hypothetical protein
MEETLSWECGQVASAVCYTIPQTGRLYQRGLSRYRNTEARVREREAATSKLRELLPCSLRGPAFGHQRQ